jgi:hypothetical protein
MQKWIKINLNDNLVALQSASLYSLPDENVQAHFLVMYCHCASNLILYLPEGLPCRKTPAPVAVSNY